jgi:hypothetical protein
MCFQRPSARVLGNPERREPAGTVCRRLIVEDRRRQLLINNDVEQVADQTVNAYLAPCRFGAETRDQVMFDLDFCWCASLGLSGSRAALHLRPC